MKPRSSTKLLIITNSLLAVSDSKNQSPRQITAICEGKKWTDLELKKAFELLSSQGAREVIVLAGADVSYSFGFWLKTDKKNLTKKIIEQVKAKVPEDFKSLEWSYRVNTQLKADFLVEVVALTTALSQKLQRLAANYHLKVLGFQTLAVNLAAQVAAQPSHIILYQGLETILVLAKAGMVLKVESLTKLNANSLKEFITYAQTTTGSVITNLYSSSGLKLAISSIQVAQLNLDPVTHMVWPQSKMMPVSDAGSSFLLPSSNIFRWLQVVALFLLVVLLSGSIAWYALQSDVTESSTQQVDQTQVTPQLPATNSDLTQLEVVIQANSVSDESVLELQQILAAESFTRLQLQQAESTSSALVVQHKEQLDQAVLDRVQRALNSEYVIDVSTNFLTADYEYDLVIIVPNSE